MLLRVAVEVLVRHALSEDVPVQQVHDSQVVAARQPLMSLGDVRRGRDAGDGPVCVGGVSGALHGIEDFALREVEVADVDHFICEGRESAALFLYVRGGRVKRQGKRKNPRGRQARRSDRRQVRLDRVVAEQCGFARLDVDPEPPACETPVVPGVVDDTDPRARPRPFSAVCTLLDAQLLDQLAHVGFVVLDRDRLEEWWVRRVAPELARKDVRHLCLTRRADQTFFDLMLRHPAEGDDQSILRGQSRHEERVVGVGACRDGDPWVRCQFWVRGWRDATHACEQSDGEMWIGLGKEAGQDVRAQSASGADEGDFGYVIRRLGHGGSGS